MIDRKTRTIPKPKGAVKIMLTIQGILGEFVQAKMNRPRGRNTLPSMLGGNLSSGGAIWAPFAMTTAAARLYRLLSGMV